MVWRRATVALLLVSVLIAPAQGETVVVNDPAGDQSYQLPNGQFRIPTAGEYRNVDIVNAGIWEEDQDTVTFYVKVAALDATAERPYPYGDPVYEIRFFYGFQGYRVVVTTFLDNAGTSAIGEPPETFGELQIQVGEEQFQPLQSLSDVELDFGDNVITAKVDRNAILDHNQAPLIRNATITEFSAKATALGWFGIPVFTGTPAQFEVGPPRAFDRAPDTRSQDGSYQMTDGPQYSKGRLLAGSLDPVRWTNGEATTFVYTIRVTNTGSSDLGIEMRQTGMPDEWQVAFSDRYIVPGNSFINVTVHVAIPFSHDHGKLQNFEVHFKTGDDSDSATAKLGVYWPKIAQPAGHHSKLWFHSTKQLASNPFEEQTTNDYHAWFNAATHLIDKTDTKEKVPADIITPPNGEGISTARWTMMLEPGLRMGLDFDLTRKANVLLELEFPLPVASPTVTVDLRHYDRTNIVPRVTEIFTAQQTEEGDVSGPITFEFKDLPISIDADWLKYVPVADLEFEITMEGRIVGMGLDNPPEWTPTFATEESEMTLPLFEYHDPLHATFTTDAAAEIRVGEEGLEKSVNPGKQTVYNMFLTYKGAFEQKFRVEVTGHEDWATVLGDETFMMEPGQEREIAIAVAPPLDAASGTYDTTVRVISVANAAVSGGMTVRTTVDRNSEYADESQKAQEKAEQLAVDPPEDSHLWVWILIICIVVAIGGGVGAIWKLRPEWLPWL